jgi:hypothetical protein
VNNHEVTFRVRLKLDETWAGNLDEDVLVEYIRDRLNSSLGFRGRVTGFALVAE